MTEIEYPFTIRPLTANEGGGYLIEFPDLPGCMSDGETIEEAIANGRDAQAAWIAAMREAAALLRLSVRTLQRLAAETDAPPKVRLTVCRIAYRRSDLRAWITARADAQHAAE